VIESLPHIIQIFSGGCDLCKETAEIVEVGKCKDCKMEVLDIEKNRELAAQLNITSVPSIVVDGKIKVAGKPTFPWFCGDDFYKMLERKYPLRKGAKAAAGSNPSSRKIDVLTAGGGGIGAAVCTIAMLLPILVGTAGAGVSAACSMPGMCQSFQLTGALGTSSAIAPIAQPLLVASVALILYGIRKFGRWPLVFSTVGGASLYISMFVLAMSPVLVIVSSVVLAVGYGFAYFGRSPRALGNEP
jgi:hypothetical protein